MANHSKHGRPFTLSLPNRSQCVKIVATVAAVGLLATGGIVSHNFYASSTQAEPTARVTAYSATDAEASRGNAREALGGDTSYVTVKINGKSRVVPGTNFTNVRSVLEAGNITLEPEDTVSPSLTTKVDEKTVITVNRAGASVEVADSSIAFNVVKKETSSLPKGQEKVETEGEEGVMESTNTRSLPSMTSLKFSEVTACVAIATPYIRVCAVYNPRHSPCIPLSAMGGTAKRLNVTRGAR